MIAAHRTAKPSLLARERSSKLLGATTGSAPHLPQPDFLPAYLAILSGCPSLASNRLPGLGLYRAVVKLATASLMLECDSKMGAGGMLSKPERPARRDLRDQCGGMLLWLSGLLTAPLWWLLLRLLSPSTLSGWAVAVAASALAPLPGMAAYYRRHKRLAAQAAQARETAAQLKSQLETVRFRTARLREDLSAADQQARLSHQLSILGQFTAGFMHEFNNPLSIVTSRLEVLLEEREDDAALCADLRQMLQEARYMGNIARTLLQALRRERGAEGAQSVGSRHRSWQAELHAFRLRRLPWRQPAGWSPQPKQPGRRGPLAPARFRRLHQGRGHQDHQQWQAASAGGYFQADASFVHAVLEDRAEQRRHQSHC